MMILYTLLIINYILAFVIVLTYDYIVKNPEVADVSDLEIFSWKAGYPIICLVLMIPFMAIILLSVAYIKIKNEDKE